MPEALETPERAGAPAAPWFSPSASTYANAMASLLFSAGANTTLAPGAVVPLLSAHSLSPEERSSRAAALRGALAVYWDLLSPPNRGPLPPVERSRSFRMALRACEYLSDPLSALKVLEAGTDGPAAQHRGYAWRRLLGMVANLGAADVADRILQEDWAWRGALRHLDRQSDLSQAILIAHQRGGSAGGALVALARCRERGLPLSTRGYTAAIAAQRGPGGYRRAALAILRAMPEPSAAACNAALLVILGGRGAGVGLGLGDRRTVGVTVEGDAVSPAKAQVREVLRIAEAAGGFRTPGSFGVALSACEAAGLNAEALALFREMAARGVWPQRAKANALLRACEAEGAAEEAAMLLGGFLREGPPPSREQWQLVLMVYVEKGMWRRAAKLAGGMAAAGRRVDPPCAERIARACAAAGRDARPLAEQLRRMGSGRSGMGIAPGEG